MEDEGTAHLWNHTVTTVDVYRSQWKWRAWSTVFDALPDVSGETILDLGCGIGDQAAELVNRGAHVIGFDMNDDFLEVARAKEMPNGEFRRADLHALPDPGVLADGLWCSFAAAYLPDLAFVLPQWCKYLRPGAWVALTEVDDLFGHAPLGDKTKNAFRAYRRQALAAGRYDFRMGRKLREYAEQAGLAVCNSFTVPDAELSFDGPASTEVALAWRKRLDGMKLLQDICGNDFTEVRDEFLAAIQRPDHRSNAKVCCVVATTPGNDGK